MRQIIIIFTLFISFQTFAQDEKLFSISGQVGLGWSKVDQIRESRDQEYFSLEPRIAYRVGFRSALTLPAGKRLFSFLAEPTFHMYEADGIADLTFGYYVPLILNAEVRYKSIELPIGVKRDFPISENIGAYATAFIIIDYVMESYVEIEDFEIWESNRPVFGAAMGAGIEINKTVYFEARWYTPRDLNASDTVWRTSYTGFGVMLGYRIP